MENKYYFCWLLIWTMLVLSLMMGGYFLATKYLYGYFAMGILSVLLTGLNFKFLDDLYETNTN